ncbi:MAG: HD domain-containing protein [Clostridiales bacterium]|jgi:exopolyphosphatase/guanosine-5'-triphosphate,3'-diphosphate pyrophosphatase|nr:HD domain-containing protein [Clostridiales bacterium]
MPKKDKFELAAVVDIGSNELRLKIAQMAKGKLKYLESLTYPLSLGRDTFNKGKIGFEKVEKACEIIRNFQTIIKEYGVTDIRAVATTAVREATNSDYFLDQLKIKTGLAITVMDDMEEKLYIYKLLMRFMKDEIKRSAMMVFIGSGNIGVSILEDGRIPFTQNIKVGSLRVSEMFDDIQEYSSEFYVVLEEYLDSFTDVLQHSLPPDVKNIVVSGTEIEMAAELIGAEKKNLFYHIPVDRFHAFYNDARLKATGQLSKELKIPVEKSELLLPALSVFNNLLGFTKAETIIASQLALSDAMLYEMLCPDDFQAINKDFGKNALLSAAVLAKKNDAVEGHYQRVGDFAVKIFDKMKKIHGMGSREKLLLQIAAILHDIGKFINLSNHFRHSYEIIMGSDIVGLNKLELSIVANIALYHSQIVPSLGDENYRKLDVYNRVLVSKLSAILRLADALDRSHKQKFSEIDVKTTDGELSITVTTDQNIDLEQWSFKEKGRFFEEVFGIKAVIRKKRVL